MRRLAPYRATLALLTALSCAPAGLHRPAAAPQAPLERSLASQVLAGSPSRCSRLFDRAERDRWQAFIQNHRRSRLSPQEKWQRFVKALGVPIAATSHSFDGKPARLLSSSENRGSQNHGIYQIENPDSPPSIVKILKINTDQWQEWNSLRAIDELQGVLLGDQFGGPQVYRIGRVTLGQSRTFLFIEMERLFPDDGGAFALKSRSLAPEQAAIQDTDGMTVYDHLAKQFIQLVQDRVLPNDPDVLISLANSRLGRPRHRLRWIDTGFWEKAQNDEQFFTEIPSVLFQLQSTLGDSNQWKSTLRNRIERTDLLNGKEKQSLLRMIRSP